MKINLREMFLIVLVIAMVLGWWIDRKSLSHENDQLCAGAGHLARLLRYQGWKFTYSESEMRMEKGPLQTAVELPPAHIKRISSIVETRVEPGRGP